MSNRNLCIYANDPGASGADAFYFTDHPETVSVEDTPIADGRVDAATLARRLEIMRPDLAIIERVGAMPGQGVSSMFNFGAAYGTVIGVVAALKIPVHFVTPAKWKKHFGLPADKEAARARALQLWPARAELFARKKDHGRAEAALIARFAAETIVGRTGE
jgi:crossover junction endodeoxyribonuclease RuvC